MRYLDKNVAIELTKLQVSEELDALKLVPAVTELLKKWDGKLLSKRFDTALKEIDPRLFYQIRYSAFYISVWTRKDYVSTPGNGCNIAHYLPEKYTELLRADYIDITGNNKSATTEGRLNADHLIERMNLSTEITRGYCEKTLDQLTRVDELIAERDRLIKGVEDFSNGLSYTIMDFFDLNIHIAR